MSTERVDRIALCDLSDSMRSAASAVASLVKDGWFWVQRQQGEPNTILFRTASDVPAVWLLRGLEHDYSEVLRQLEIAREGLIRWKAMKSDLMDNPGSTVSLLDYCPEVDPDEIALLGEGCFSPCPTLEINAYRLADILLVGECTLGVCAGLELAEEMVVTLTKKVSLLTALRRKLDQARVEIWPGTTRSDAH